MKKILSTRVLVKIGVLTTILLVLIICTVWGNSALMVSTVNISRLHKCPTCIMLNLEKAIQN